MPKEAASVELGESPPLRDVLRHRQIRPFVCEEIGRHAEPNTMYDESQQYDESRA